MGILESFKLEGRVALVTGSSRGIGRAIALGLAEAGADVVITSRSIADLTQVAEEIRATGRKALAIEGNLPNSDDINRLINGTLKEFGKIDILVNNAGIYEGGAAEDVSEQEWDSILDVNLKGVFLCCQAAGKKMIEQKRGKIINIASISGSIANATPPYCASKAGVILLTRALAVEWAKYGINVNAISPGSILTRMSKSEVEDQELNEQIIHRTPLGRWGKPDDIVGTAVFLASGASDFVTGHDVMVDGGFLFSAPR